MAGARPRTKAGSIVRQRAITCGQRGANWQPGGRLRKIGRRARDRLERLVTVIIQADSAIKQRARVGMLRRVEEGVDIGALDDAARIHDDDLVGESGDDAEIVRDQQQGRLHLLCRLCSSRRIFACTVTSSAVVGSSAMMISGRQAIAMAISTRWRMPPLK